MYTNQENSELFINAEVVMKSVLGITNTMFLEYCYALC